MANQLSVNSRNPPEPLRRSDAALTTPPRPAAAFGKEAEDACRPPAGSRVSLASSSKPGSRLISIFTWGSLAFPWRLRMASRRGRAGGGEQRKKRAGVERHFQLVQFGSFSSSRKTATHKTQQNNIVIGPTNMGWKLEARNTSCSAREGKHQTRSASTGAFAAPLPPHCRLSPTHHHKHGVSAN